jgi:hypothetical protein
MLRQVRQTVVKTLWGKYRDTSAQIRLIETGLQKKGVEYLILDHFAIIDLPGPHTGIRYLSELFSAIGYTVRGQDYLADKQNDFLWMAESDSAHSAAREVLPQVVVADFRLDELPPEVSNIIQKYASHAQALPDTEIRQLASRASLDDPQAAKQLGNRVIHYLTGRDWPLPTRKEFYTVQEYNELLAWVLIFGRRPNHFTLSIHLLDHFANLADFHQFVENDLQLTLNRDGGMIKGGPLVGIAQGSTTGIKQRITLAEGDIELPIGFVEFVWRYPRGPSCQRPVLWDDFFTGFIAQHADRVIESLYVHG